MTYVEHASESRRKELKEQGVVGGEARQAGIKEPVTAAQGQTSPQGCPD